MRTQNLSYSIFRGIAVGVVGVAVTDGFWKSIVVIVALASAFVLTDMITLEEN